MGDYRVIASGSILSRYADQIAALGDNRALVAIARAFNHEGDKGRTQIKRALVKQTGIKAGAAAKTMKSLRATPTRLAYTIIQDGQETNLISFGARQQKSGVSSAPWNVRRVFRDEGRGSFITGGKVYIRDGSPSYPIRPLAGPNLAREIVKDEARAEWDRVPVALADRIGHELRWMMPK